MAIPNLLLSLLLVSHVILSMPSPSFACLLPCESEINLLFYLHQKYGGPGKNQITSFTGTERYWFGTTAIMDWAVLDGPHPENATIVARATGMHVQADLAGPGWFLYSSIEFRGARFGGSSLQVMGTLSEGTKGQLAIIGGTGKLAMARGVIKYKARTLLPGMSQSMREINIHAIYVPSTGSTAGAAIL